MMFTDITKRTLLFLFLLFAAVGASFAQVDCPQTDCPGRCGRFVDNDGDGFCDHGLLSKPAAAPAETAKSTDKVQADQTSGAPASNTPTHTKEATTKPEKPAVAEEIPDPESETAPTEELAPLNDETDEQVEAPVAKHRAPYPVIPVVGGLVALYLLSCLLVRKNAWSKATHRKVWNVLLTVTFLVSCLLGVLLAIFINYDYFPDGYKTLLHWHVYFGIGMTAIAIFHALWHLNYFKALFAKRKE